MVSSSAVWMCPFILAVVVLTCATVRDESEKEESAYEATDSHQGEEKGHVFTYDEAVRAKAAKTMASEDLGLEGAGFCEKEVRDLAASKKYENSKWLGKLASFFRGFAHALKEMVIEGKVVGNRVPASAINCKNVLTWHQDMLENHFWYLHSDKVLWEKKGFNSCVAEGFKNVGFEPNWVPDQYWRDQRQVLDVMWAEAASSQFVECQGGQGLELEVTKRCKDKFKKEMMPILQKATNRANTFHVYWAKEKAQIGRLGDEDCAYALFKLASCPCVTAWEKQEVGSLKKEFLEGAQKNLLQQAALVKNIADYQSLYHSSLNGDCYKMARNKKKGSIPLTGIQQLIAPELDSGTDLEDEDKIAVLGETCALGHECTVQYKFRNAAARVISMLGSAVIYLGIEAAEESLMGPVAYSNFKLATPGIPITESAVALLSIPLIATTRKDISCAPVTCAWSEQKQRCQLVTTGPMSAKSLSNKGLKNHIKDGFNEIKEKFKSGKFDESDLSDDWRRLAPGMKCSAEETEKRWSCSLTLCNSLDHQYKRQGEGQMEFETNQHTGLMNCNFAYSKASRQTEFVVPTA